MWLGARNPWIIYQCCSNLCKAGPRENFVTSLARKHQDISFITHQMREKRNAMCLIVIVSAFVTYKRALRKNNTHTHTQNTNTKNELYKKTQEGNNTKKPKEKPKKTPFRRHRKTVQKEMIQIHLQQYTTITKNQKNHKNKKTILRDSSQGSGSPTESLRIGVFCFLVFGFVEILCVLLLFARFSCVFRVLF